MQDLLKPENKDQLSAILLRHVVPELILASEFPEDVTTVSVNTDLGRLIYNFHFDKGILVKLLTLCYVEFSQKSKFRVSKMTQFADFDGY